MDLIKLETNSNNKLICPQCKGELRKVEGGGIQIVDGKVDMETTKPRHICDNCGVFYRELLTSGYYNIFDLPENERQSKKSFVEVKDIPPQQIKRDADGKATCPRCGQKMDFIAAQPVQIVDGKPDFSNTMDHFKCPHCKSFFRKIATTDFYQWSEK